MHPQARQTLRELRSLTNIEIYLRTARAELASDPGDETLRAFITVVESLLRDEKTKLALVRDPSEIPRVGRNGMRQ